LVRAEFVGLDDAAPESVHAVRAFRTLTDAVTPVVLVGEAAAGPAQHRHFELPERGQYVGAIAAGVGDRGAFAHPDAFVDIAAKVFHELPVQGRIDGRARLV